MRRKSLQNRGRTHTRGEPIALQKSGNVKERKGLLGRALRDSGYQSLGHACLVAGADESIVGRILNGKLPLIGKSGAVNTSALRLAEVLGETAERLFGVDMTWPATLDIVIVRKGYDDTHSWVRRMLSTLTKHEEYVLTRRFFGQCTIEEVAAECHASRERIRQIECKALRKLRHPSRARTLWSCFSDDPYRRPGLGIW